MSDSRKEAEAMSLTIARMILSLADKHDAEIKALKDRIAELEGKNTDKADGPDWSTAPKWAKWWAVDEDGYACYYDKKPSLVYDGWIEKDNFAIDKKYPYFSNWKDSLTKRPAKV